MGFTAWYYAGIRLRDNEVLYRESYAGDVDTDGGVTRKTGTINPDSPNFRGAIEVQTEIPPNTARAGLTRHTSLMIDLAAHAAELRTVTWGALHALARVEDEDRRGDASGSGVEGVTLVAVSGLGAGWVPAVGEYVLLREVGGPDGFVAEVLAYSGGNVSIYAPQGVPASGWEILRTELHYPHTKFVGMDPGGPPSGDPAANVYRSAQNPVTFSFLTHGDPTYALAHAPEGV